MIRRSRILPSAKPLEKTFNPHVMLLSPIRSARFRFIYTFQSGHKLIGWVEGNRFQNTPNLVFNLRALQATCCDPQGNFLIGFDTVFGQFSIDTPDILFSGSHSVQGSFFSFNYRNGDAAVYDARTDAWVASGWDPESWSIEEVAFPDRELYVPDVDPTLRIRDINTFKRALQRMKR